MGVPGGVWWVYPDGWVFFVGVPGWGGGLSRLCGCGGLVGGGGLVVSGGNPHTQQSIVSIASGYARLGEGLVVSGCARLDGGLVGVPGWVGGGLVGVPRWVLSGCTRMGGS